MSYREFPVYVPLGEEHLCAVVCAPEGEHVDLAVALLTGGNYTRTHRNRMWVRVARALAGQGIPSIRVDYHGVGDSTGRAVMSLQAPFEDDVLAAAGFLKLATGVSKLAFVATCFGSHSALGAAARHPDCVSITMFPVPLLVRPGPERVLARRRVKRWLRRSGFGERLLKRSTIKRARTAVAQRRDRTDEVIAPKFRRDLTTFAKRGGRVRFVYGERTDVLPELRRCLAEVAPHLSGDERERIDLDLVADAELHRFQTLESQNLVVQRAVASAVEALALPVAASG